jgi:hypothetical protein
MTELEFIQEFADEFKQKISLQTAYAGVSLSINSTWVGFGNKTVTFDAVLYRDNTPLAVFEFKNYKTSDILKLSRESLEVSMDFVKYFIIADGKKYIILDLSNEDVKTVESIDQLIVELLERPANIQVANIQKEIAQIIYDISLEHFEGNHKILRFLTLSKIQKNILYNKSGQFFHLSKDIRDLSNFENSLFNMLIEDVKENDEIHRYTSLETVFATLNYKSIRLNGIVGMNDISEIGYVESYLDKNYQPFWSDNTPDSYIGEINRRFISSSSILEDDLNQWRLYAEDSRGSCLTFKVKKQGKVPGIRLKKISYGKKINGKNHHEILEFIKKIVEKVKVDVKQILRFRSLDIWKHFFKSYEYQPEHEVRLLIIISPNDSIKGEKKYGASPHSLKREWNLTYSHKIANPFITIDLADSILPIQLTKVWLGPKSPEKYVNKKQIEEFLRFKNLKGIEVKISNIQSYR